MSQTNMWQIEEGFFDQGIKLIAGVDEAGRGPLSGPVFAAAVILPVGLYIEGLNDSKKLTPKKRDLLFDQICEQAISYGIASASVEEIDSLNILEASLLAMRRAIAMLSPAPQFALIDGNCQKGFTLPVQAVVKGDAISCSISAASILAKVSRDRLCDEHDKLYPMYGFAKHKGYGTKAHMDAIREYGPCPLHRKTFLKFLEK